MTTLDFSALRTSGPAPLVRRFKPDAVAWPLNPVIAAVPGLIALLATVLVLTQAFQVDATQPRFSSFLILVMSLLGLSIPGAFVLVTLWYVLNTETVPSLTGRLPAFAAMNGLAFTARASSPSYPGTLFRFGSEAKVRNRLRSTSGRYFDLGDLTYLEQPGDARSQKNWGFLAVHLGRPLPHMVLEATLSGFPGWRLPFEFDRTQVLALEGDFGRHFTLYCPTGYERDALYVFAPDLMSLLVEHADGLHVEVIDEWLFVYAPRTFKGESVEEYERLFAIIGVVGAKAVRQTAHYVDERVTRGEGRSVALAVSRLGWRLREAGRDQGGWLLAGTGTGFILGVVCFVVLK